MNQAPDTRIALQQYYDRIAPYKLAPLWEVLKGLQPPEPTSKAAPYLWRYDEVRPLLLESGSLLTAEEAERRVLVLENPSLIGQSKITNTLYAGLQLIMPGEIAPAHRHTPTALRFVLEGEGGFTSVAGERTTMRFGDFIITPNWAYHDHGNEGEEPVAWLDGLDIPLVNFFESSFGEGYDEKRQVLSRPEGDSLARFGTGLLPLHSESRYGLTTPIFNYPYERSREALLTAAAGEAPDPHLGTTLRFANPLDGGWAMPTMATWMTYLEAGFETAPIRSTDGMIVAVAEGTGSVTIGDTVFEFTPRDVMVMPAWTWRRFKARENCLLFCFSDRVAQEKLGLFREQRSQAGHHP